jgi:hypothetical protein
MATTTRPSLALTASDLTSRDVVNPLSDLARVVVGVHLPTLIVVDAQHRPIGTVSCVEVLAALAHPGRSAADG